MLARIVIAAFTLGCLIILAGAYYVWPTVPTLIAGFALIIPSVIIAAAQAAEWNGTTND